MSQLFVFGRSTIDGRGEKFSPRPLAFTTPGRLYLRVRECFGRFSMDRRQSRTRGTTMSSQPKQGGAQDDDFGTNFKSLPLWRKLLVACVMLALFTIVLLAKAYWHVGPP